MADTINPKAIQKIRVGSQDHPIDAVTIEGKVKEDIGDLVTEIDGTSTDLEYPSAKCMYDIIYKDPS